MEFADKDSNDLAIFKREFHPFCFAIALFTRKI